LADGEKEDEDDEDDEGSEDRNLGEEDDDV
jgi:hypothetical protein